MRIRERHANGARIDWLIPDNNGWDIGGLLSQWRQYNSELMDLIESQPEDPQQEEAAFPMGFQVETTSETNVDDAAE